MPDPRKESLDEIVSRSAVVLADQIQKAAAWAKSEMDLQVEVAAALKDFARRAQITLEGHQNVTIGTGRPDSVYSNVIVEYKDPGTLSANRDASNNKKLIEQVRQRFYDMRREEHRAMHSMFGVGTDGKYFIFVRFRDEKWTDEEPLEVNHHSVERFLWALYNLGQKGKPYQPEYLHGDFGSDSTIAQEGVRTLYDEVLNTDNPKTQVFFNQWKILFGEVCGYDVENLSDRLKKLAEFYAVKGKPHPGQLLFALHTYYALLIKLLAAEIVSFFNPWMTRQVEKLQNATTSAKLKRELEQLERGGIFHELGITNFLEGDLFAWYLAVWSEPIENVARRMIQKLDEYNPGTFSEDPVQSRDLLKKLYQQLFPKSVRHDLGEYYTPDWLAEHVLNQLGYEGDPDKRLLDPACGSGTFLVMAINRIRRWYEANREECAYDEGELLNKILANVIGFDLNPLAVMAARTNYLVAIKDLIRHSGQVEIPVYLCDSIMTPAEYGDLFMGVGSVARVPCSAMKPPYLLVPKEIAKSPKEVAAYAEVLEKCIRNAYKPQEFVALCKEEGLTFTATDSHLDLYKELVRLDRENKNGIWARIIKNNFAPLFVGKVDHVAGNPPWVNWDALPAEYRSASESIWTSCGLIGSIPLKKRQSSDKAKTDISILMTYVAADAYLKEGGLLGFVITRSVFQSEVGGWHFRRFSIPGKWKLKVRRTDDLDRLKPFRARAANVTASVILEKGQATTYPVSYFRWEPLRKGVGDEDDSLAEILRGSRAFEWAAYPVRKEWPQSSWIVGPENSVQILRRIIGASPYAETAREGVNTRGANGVYFVDVLEKNGPRYAIRNRASDGEEDQRVPVIESIVESDFLFPLLRGRDVEKWIANPASAILLPHHPKEPVEPVSERTLGTGARDFLEQFKEKLSSRKKFRNFDPSGPNWYGVYSVLDATFAPHKVVWREMARGSVAAVVSSAELKLKAGFKVVVPDHKLMIVPAADAPEANYVAACLNSSIVRYIVLSFAISTGISIHILDKIPIAKFDGSTNLHKHLARLSAKCHQLAREERRGELDKVEGEVDEAMAEMWSIKTRELSTIRDTLRQCERVSDD